MVQELDRWEERLEELFAGRPYDIYDAALTATISDFPVSIQPFRDMVSSHHSVKRCRSSTLLTLHGIVMPVHVLGPWAVLLGAAAAKHKLPVESH